MKTLFLSLIFLFFSVVTMAQTATQVAMADGLRSSGMIYVVVAVMTVIFAGLLIYLFSMDRRMRKIENSQKAKN